MKSIHQQFLGNETRLSDLEHPATSSMGNMRSKCGSNLCGHHLREPNSSSSSSASVWWLFDVSSRCDRPLSRFATTRNQMIPASHVRSKSGICGEANLDNCEHTIDASEHTNDFWHTFFSSIYSRRIWHDFCFMMLTFQKSQPIHSDIFNMELNHLTPINCLFLFEYWQFIRQL